MRKFLRAVAFLLILVLVYVGVAVVLKPKTTDGIQVMDQYRSLPSDAVDVLFVGSSHVGMNVDNAALLDEYGIASYTCWSGMQTLWGSYYYLREALQQQDPDVVVVEVFLASSNVDYADTSAATKLVLSLTPGFNRIHAALDSFATWQQAAEVLWGMPTYHTRYQELTEDDYIYPVTARSNGVQTVSYASEQTYPVRILEYTSVTEMTALSAKNEKFLRAIIELCAAKNKPLVLMISPYEATADEISRFKRVEEIAAEYSGVKVLNYLRDFDDTGLTASTDFLDVGHLNMKGVAIFTRKLGNDLKTMFELPDRRIDTAHIWYARTDTANDRQPAWRLSEQFYGNGRSSYVDTGVKLYGNAYASWTVFATIDPEIAEGGDQVYFSCFSEDTTAGYYGLLVRRKDNGRLSVRVGGNIEYEMEMPENEFTLAIVKDVQTYSIYLNGEQVYANQKLPCNAYEGALLLGCQELTADGEKFRYSAVHLTDLAVYEKAMSAAEVLNLRAADLPVPAGRITADAFTLQEQFMGSTSLWKQDSFIDTGVSITADPAGCWAVIADIVPGQLSGDMVYFADFAEEENAYRGLLVRQISDTELNIVYGNNMGFNVPVVSGESMRIVVLRDSDLWSVWVDGQQLVDRISSPIAPYEGTMLIGAQQAGDGSIFRKSQTHVTAMKIVSGTWKAEEILQMQLDPAPEPQPRVATSAAYVLKDAFRGNAKDSFVNTGIALYDAGKAWTLDTVLPVTYGSNAGVYMSCFSEQEGDYRGFMIRQDAVDSLTVFVGKQSCSIPFDSTTRNLHLVIVRDDSRYTVCADGKTLFETESPCEAYDGTLFLGCQVQADGVSLFRFSETHVASLTITDGAVDREEAERLSTVSTNGRFN